MTHLPTNDPRRRTKAAKVQRSLECGCVIRLVKPGSFVLGLCDLHEAYPDWIDPDDYWNLYDEMEEEAMT